MSLPLRLAQQATPDPEPAPAPDFKCGPCAPVNNDPYHLGDALIAVGLGALTEGAGDALLAPEAGGALAPAAGVPEWGGSITAGGVPEGGMNAFRIWGGASKQAGDFLSPISFESAGEARGLLSLPPGNSAEFQSLVHIPGGTQIQFGPAAGAFGQTGGGIQIQLLEHIPLGNFGPGIPLAP